MSVEIRVLGPVLATVHGASVVPAARRPRQLLAMLALNPGRLVTAAELVEEIWGDRPPAVPLASLQTYVLQLRKCLDRAPAGADRRSARDILLTSPGGYVLDLPPDDVDVGRYERLVRAGRLAVRRGDFPAAAATLAHALGVWRGPVVDGLAIGPRLRLERLRLAESRLYTLDLRIDADLRLGRHRTVLDELATLCARHPRFENFHAQYMLALHRSGLRSAALEVYPTLCATVGKPLGVEPSRHLRHLHRAILADDPAIARPTFVVSELGSRDSA